MTIPDHLSELIEMMAQENAEQQREAVVQIARELTSNQKMEMAEIEELIASKLPDPDHIARQIVAETTLSSIVQDAVLKPLARAALSGLVDDCMRKTLAQTDFAEVLSDNLQQTIEQ